MKLNIIIAGFIIALITFCLNFVAPVQYLKTNDFMVAGGNAYYIIYFFFPLIIVVAAPLLIKRWPSVIFKRIYIGLILLNIMSEFLFAWFMIADSNKVLYTINNMSPRLITNANVVARNKQNVFIGDIAAGKLKKIYCDCRDVDVDSNDTVGFILSYRINNKNIRLNLLGPNENLSDRSIEIRIVNDSMAYKSADYANEILWDGIGFGVDKGELPWDSIEKTPPRKR